MPTTTKTPAKKTTGARAGTAAKTSAARTTAKKATPPRPDMIVDLAPTDHDVPLLGGPGAGMPHVADVALDQLASHPRNPRRSIHGLEEMADSMREHGVLERLLVAPTPTTMDPHPGVPWLVLAGHRRLAAAALADLTAVPIEIRYDLDTVERQVSAMLVENIHRQDLTPVEEAEAYQGLLDLGELDEQGIARSTGRSLATVRQRLRLAKSPAAARHAVQEHTATLAEVELLWESDGDPTQQQALEELAAGNDARPALQRAATAAHRRAAAKATLAAAVADGVPVVTLPKHWSAYSGKPGDLAYALHGYQKQLTAEDIAGHAACAGHAVADRTDDLWYPELVWVCKTPDKHKRTTSGGGLTDAEKKDRAETRERNKKQRELQDVFDVATSVRRRHLRDLIAGGGAPKADDQLGVLLSRASLQEAWYAQHEQARARVRILVDLIDHELPEAAQKALDDKWSSPTTAIASVSTALLHLKPHHAVLATTAALCEATIAGSWTPSSPTRLPELARDWLTTCRDHLGYQLTPDEQDLLGKATATALAEVDR